MNGHSLRIATTTAIEECLVTAITKAAMLAALHDQPKFSELFMAYLLTRNSRIEEDLIDQLFNSSEKRLARLLLLLANFGKEGSPQLISPNISQETLAEMIGTTRSRVSFFMNKFRKLGFITLQRKDRGQQFIAERGLVRQARDQARAVRTDVGPVIDRHFIAGQALAQRAAQASIDATSSFAIPIRRRLEGGAR